MSRNVLKWGALVLAVTSGAHMACSTHSGEGTGRVAVALVASGAGGVIYTLPEETRLRVSNLQFFDEFSMDGATSVVTIEVPTGDYQPLLVHDGGYTTVWPLRRDLPDGSSDIAQATLTMPTSVTVLEGQTTSLVIRFSVATGEIIEFAQGSIATTVIVDEVLASAYDLDLTATLTTQFGSVFGDAPPELVARMPAAGTSGLQVQVALHIDGPWTQASSARVCASAQVIDMIALGQPAFVDMLNESIQGFTTLCLTAVDETHTGITLGIGLGFGVATTPTFSDLGDRRFTFDTAVSAIVEKKVLDSGTLNLAALQGSHAAPFEVRNNVSGTLVGETAPLLDWYVGFHSGAGTVTFTPL